MKHYPLEPRPLSLVLWFYETEKGIEIVDKHHDHATTHIISWRKLANAVARHQRIRKRMLRLKKKKAWQL